MKYDFSIMKNGLLNTDDWNIENGHEFDFNGESQEYTSQYENLKIENGELVIQAVPDAKSASRYTSARINTKDKFSFTHGTLEVEMKLPRGVGSWPAAWLMPQDDIYKIDQFGIKANDPKSWALNGEIDFIKSIGALPGEIIPAAHSYSSLQKEAMYTPAYVNDAYNTYHRYGLIKQPGKITFTVDGVPYATREKWSEDVKEWPFEQLYYLILNLAVGGKWAGEKGIDNSSMPWQLKIRSINYTP